MAEDVTWRMLANEMSEISEQGFCAGWMDELEYRLWEIVRGGPRKYGQIVLTDEQIARLQDLADRLHGWVRFNDVLEVEEFVDRARWQELYDGWVQERSSRGQQD